MSRRAGEEDWTLSEYEECREPHALQEEGTVSISRGDLVDLVKCPICLSVLENTVTVRDCLHRFCAECIARSERQCSGKCPTCRKPFKRRQLQHDTKFDDIRSVIFPVNKAQYEEEQLLVLERIQFHNNLSALPQVVAQGKEEQAGRRLSRHERPRGRRSSSGSDAAARPSKRSRKPASAPAPDEAVEFEFVPHPDDPGTPHLDRRFLSVPVAGTVAHLHKYLQHMFQGHSRYPCGRLHVQVFLQGSKPRPSPLNPRDKLTKHISSTPLPSDPIPKLLYRLHADE